MTLLLLLDLFRLSNFSPEKNHLTIRRRFEPLSCSLEKLRASMKMPNLGRIYSRGPGHMISNGETTSTNEKRSRVVIDSKLPSRPGSLTRFGAG